MKLISIHSITMTSTCCKFRILLYNAKLVLLCHIYNYLNPKVMLIYRLPLSISELNFEDSNLLHLHYFNEHVKLHMV